MQIFPKQVSTASFNIIICKMGLLNIVASVEEISQN